MGVLGLQTDYKGQKQGIENKLKGRKATGMGAGILALKGQRLERRQAWAHRQMAVYEGKMGSYALE